MTAHDDGPTQLWARPQGFTGSFSERVANQNTHTWQADRTICLACGTTWEDRRASWPCGYDVPLEDDETIGRLL